MSMCGDGVSNISAGADEGVGGMVNGTGLTSGSIARSVGCGGQRLALTMSSGDRGGFGKEVLG